MEGPFGKLKSGNSLGGEACQAFGTPAHTIAATAAIVAYNLKLAINNGHDTDNSPDEDDPPDSKDEPADTTDACVAQTDDTADFDGRVNTRRRAPP